MKNTQLIVFGLTLSLAANLALALVLMRPPAPTVPTASSATVSGNTSMAATPAPAVPSALPARPISKDTELWKLVGSSDNATLIANLRKAGVSPKLLQVIARALIEEKYRSRMIEIYAGGKDAPYWKTTNIFYSGDKSWKARQQLHREMNAELKTIMGESYSMVLPEMLPQLQNQYGNLSADKLEKLMRIQQDYNELRGEIGAGSAMLPADREKLALLKKEQRADIEKLLTKEQLLEYDLRNSPAASRLRFMGSSSELLNLSEAEFRTLVPIYLAIENQLPEQTGSNYQEIQKAREAAEAQIQEQIKAALGDARYADYKQANDKEAYQENRLVARLGLPLSTAAQLVEAKKEFRDLSRSITKDKELTNEQKKEQLAVLTKETEAKVTTLIGERGLNAYRQYGGNWLQSGIATTRVSTPISQ